MRLRVPFVIIALLGASWGGQQYSQAKAGLKLVQTNFVGRTFAVMRSYIDGLFGEEAVPILIAGVTYLVIKTTGVMGLFSFVTTIVTTVNRQVNK